MPQPVPPPPPAKGFGLIPWFIIFIVAVAVLGYFQGWFEFKKNPETGKTELVTHGDKFKADKDAALKSTGEAYKKAKDKITNMIAKSKDSKPEDKATIDKQIDELKKQLSDLEAKQKAAETATDEGALKKATEGLDETVKKLLDPK